MIKYEDNSKSDQDSQLEFLCDYKECKATIISIYFQYGDDPSKKELKIFSNYLVYCSKKHRDLAQKIRIN